MNTQFFYLIPKKEDNCFLLDKIINQQTGEIISLEELINTYNYAFVDDNINLVWAHICQLLEQMGYSQDEFAVNNEKIYSLSYKSGSCANITIRNNLNVLRIANFSSKFNLDFGDFEYNVKLLNYAVKKERLSASLGNDAFNEWIRTAFKVHGRTLNINASKAVFRRDYPILSDGDTKILETAKTSVSGFQHVVPGRYKNIYEYDICSSFPSQLKNDTPKGETILFDKISEVPLNYFYIVKFTALNVKIKANCFEIFPSKEVLTLTLTKHMFELFKNNYTYDVIEEHFVIAYKTRSNIFNEFVNNNIIAGKVNEQDKDIAKYNKFLTNSIIGYFGRNTNRENSYLIKQFGEYKIYRKQVKIEPIYQPIYLFVNGKSKAEFITTLQNLVGKEHIIYANTDGFLTDIELNLEKLNFGRNSDIGCFKFKGKFEDIQINCINGYVGITSDNVTKQAVSGIKLQGLLTPEQYANAEYEYLVHELDAKTGLIKETKLQG